MLNANPIVMQMAHIFGRILGEYLPKICLNVIIIHDFEK